MRVSGHEGQYAYLFLSSKLAMLDEAETAPETMMLAAGLSDGTSVT